MRGLNLIFLVILSLLAAVVTGCKRGGSDSGSPPSLPIFTPNLIAIPVTGITVGLGTFDPAPTVDGSGGLWMSYSQVSLAPSGLKKVETRLATTADGGLSWQDMGVVNTATTLPLPPPNDVNAITHEVSRLVYNPFAVAAGADPWLMLWHRYLTVFNGSDNLSLFEHGWIAMKSGATAMSLGSERKLFTGFGYDSINNGDSFGAPEYPLSTLFPAELGGCVVFTEPGVLPKSSGVYVALLCARLPPPGKIILLRCDHSMDNCAHLGTLLEGSDATAIDSSYTDFSAAELVSSAGQDYLIVTPVIKSSDIYRGCVVYRITNIDQAAVERSAGALAPLWILPAHGDFNGACGYTPGLSGSGIMISEAFFSQLPIFRMFTTGLTLP